MIANLKPHNCPRYPRCSAAICPLDLRWDQRVNHLDEEVCHLLRISQQPESAAAATFFDTYFEPGFLDELQGMLPLILTRYPSVAKGLSVKQDRPLRTKHKPKNYTKPKAKSSPEQCQQQMQEYLSNASGRPTSDLNDGVATLAYPRGNNNE